MSVDLLEVAKFCAAVLMVGLTFGVVGVIGKAILFPSKKADKSE